MWGRTPDILLRPFWGESAQVQKDTLIKGLNSSIKLWDEAFTMEKGRGHEKAKYQA